MSTADEIELRKLEILQGKRSPNGALDDFPEPDRYDPAGMPLWDHPELEGLTDLYITVQSYSSREPSTGDEQTE
jgi:hypothetical protein